jgi:AraC-like DNA-binding protein
MKSGGTEDRVDDRAADSVMRAIDMVEERMGDEVGAEDMASAACYSPFYFSRLFARATGHSPYDYLMRRRVAAAAEEVVGGAMSLTEIALDHGFDLGDSFARAFRRCFGKLPSEARRDGSFPRKLARTAIARSYVEALLEEPFAPPRAAASGDEIIEGAWSVPASDGGSPPSFPEGEGVALIERDSSLGARRAFVGKAVALGTPPRVPSYPLSATIVPGGRRARFAIGADFARLEAAIEFAYRAWLPQSGRLRAPDYDQIETDGSGFISLVLPLEGGPDGS